MPRMHGLPPMTLGFSVMRWMSGNCMVPL
jgi:hypothetical protein